jgi:hypothetical protein
MRLQRRGDGGGYDSIAVAIGVRVMRWIETTIRVTMIEPWGWTSSRSRSVADAFTVHGWSACHILEGDEAPAQRWPSSRAAWST